MSESQHELYYETPITKGTLDEVSIFLYNLHLAFDLLGRDQPAQFGFSGASESQMLFIRDEFVDQFVLEQIDYWRGELLKVGVRVDISWPTMGDQ